MTLSAQTSSKWPKVRFDQMAECLTVRVDPSETKLDRYVGLEHLDPETLKISRWGAPADVIGEKLHFWPGDIIFGKRRAYQRKLAVADFEGICSAHAMVLRAKPEVILPEFLPFFMQSDLFFERALSISVGSLSPTINWSALARQEFPLPPLDEQRRISEILWATDEVINKYRFAVTSLRNLQDCYREQLYFNKGGTSIYVKDIASIRYGLGQPPPESETGIRMIRATDISNGNIIGDSIMRVDISAVSRERAIFLEEGDIIIVRSGAYTGDSAMITSGYQGSIAGYDLVIRPQSNIVVPIFLSEFFLHTRTIEQVLKPMSIRSAQPHLNTTDIGSIKLPLPSYKDQELAADQLCTIRNRVTQLSDHILATTKNFKMVREELLCNK